MLDWFNVGKARGVPPQHLTDFAGKFFGAMHDDGAVLPKVTADSAVQRLRSCFCTTQRAKKAPAHSSTWVLPSAGWLLPDPRPRAVIDGVCATR